MNNEKPFFSDTELRDLLDRISSFTYPELPFATMVNNRLRVIFEATNARIVYLLRVDEDMKRHLCRYHYVTPGKFFVPSATPQAWAARRLVTTEREIECLVKGKTIHVSNIGKQRQVTADGRPKTGRRGSIHTPVIVNGKPWGILELFGDARLGWDDTVVNLLEETAAGFALIIKNEAADSPWLRETGLVAAHGSRELQALASISLGFVVRQSYKELGLLLKTILNELYEDVDPVHAAFFPCMLQDDGVVFPNGPCVFEDRTAWRDPLKSGKFHSFAEHLCLPHLVRTNEPYLCEDTLEDPAFASIFCGEMAKNMRTHVAAPMRHAPTGILGILLASHKDPGFFKEREVIFFQHAADIMGMGIAHRRAEEALRGTTQRLQTILDTMEDSINVMAPDGTVLWVNENDPAAIPNCVGKKCWEVFESHNSRCPHCVHPLILADGKPREYETSIISRDTGRPVYLLVRAAPMRNASGEIEAILELAINITDRKKADEEKLNLERQVQHVQKLESLGVLAGGIAHDFNNLLMGVLGNADLALLDLSPVAPARENLHEIEKAARSAADLARQMLAYSGKGAFAVTPVDLSEVVKEMSHLLMSSVSKTTLLKYDFEENAP
ncbi:GAF domain-containing protein, partial [Candidatus Hydrogenedentota bacterium]